MLWLLTIPAVFWVVVVVLALLSKPTESEESEPLCPGCGCKASSDTCWECGYSHESDLVQESD